MTTYAEPLPRATAAHPRGLALDEPVIVLTAARCGSTLLRLLLDAHPDLACPAETNIIKLCAQLAGVFKVTGQEDASGDDAPSAALRKRISGTVDEVFAGYLADRGKRRWCDKSIGTAPVADWFAGVYPKARFICLYRHCLDVIHSGLEASPWGLLGYGFEQFAGTRGGNNVSALAAYWIEHTSRILEFEQSHPERCLRVHYERLVADPERAAERIFGFLGAANVPGISWRCFSGGTADAAVTGPGDHKIRATSKITADSVGSGIRIPAEMIPAPQLAFVNRLLGDLGYTPVDSAWRTSACPPVLLAGESAQADGGARDGQPESFGDDVVLAVLDSIGEVFRSHVGAGLRLGVPSVSQGGAGQHGADQRRFGLVAYHPDAHRLARGWLVDLHKRSITEIAGFDGGPVDADWLLTGDVETWLGVLSGRSNMASCLRLGALRYIGLDEAEQPAAATAEDQMTRAAQTERRLAVARELLGLAAYPEEPGGLELPQPGIHHPDRDPVADERLGVD
jgi:protein-tyrosine sulfotransferase